MGEDREAVGFKDTDVVSDKVATRVNELANRMDEALHFKQPTRQWNRGRNRKCAKTENDVDQGPTSNPREKAVSSNWRQRVASAKKHAAATLTVVRLLATKLVKMRNYYDFMPPAIEEALDVDYKHFLQEYAKITKVLTDVREAHELKAKTAPNKTSHDKKKMETDDLLRRTGVNASELLSTRNSDEARMFAKEAVLKSRQAEQDELHGVDRQDERIRSSLTLLETYLSRANELAGIVHKDEEGEDGQPSAQKLQSPLKNPGTQSHNIWQNNPRNKPEVLRMTSEAKSNAKYGRVAVLIFAADLGPELRGNERQPLWSMEPYEMLAEIHRDQVYKEYLEKAAALKKEKDEAVARGEAEASAEAELPIQPPTVTTPMTTRVEGMSVGSRLMTQLVADVNESCGAKAVESLKVIIVVSNATTSIVTKDMRANGFFGLKQENVMFVTQPDLPGFRYVPEINLFREDGYAKHARYGSGYVIEQLTCPGEAFLISDANGTICHLVESALDHLSSIGVQWIFKTHIRLISSEVFDIRFMAHSMALKDRFDANMIVDVVETTLHTSRKWGNIAAARLPTAESKFEPGAPYFTRVIGYEALSSSEAQHAILQMFEAQPENKKTLYSATGRWMLLLADMQEALDKFRFSQSLCLEYELEEEARLPRLKSPPAIYPQVYAHDLTLVDAIRPLSIAVDADHAPKDIGQLKIADPVGFIRCISKAQDASPAFQNLVKKASLKAKAMGKCAPSLVINTGSTRRHVIMVAVAENKSCHVGLELVNSLVIPGVDEIHMVHFCKNSEAAPRAHKVISQFDVESAVQVTRHVLIQPSGKSIVELLAETAVGLKASLLVISSEKLSTSREPIMGSVAVRFCRTNLPCSLLVVKSHSVAAKNASLGLSYVVGVDQAALKTFDWLCNIARRGQDKFYLANCSGTSATAAAVTRHTNTSANIIQVFKDKAVSCGFISVGRSLEGKASVELPKLAHQVQADVVVISTTKNSGEMSKGAAAIVQDPHTSAVLIFRPTDDGRMGL